MDEIKVERGVTPKRIFFFWGNEKMSWMRYMTLYSFRKLNPDWDITLYCTRTNVNVKTWDGNLNAQDFHMFEGDDYFDKIKDLNINIVNWNLKDNKIQETNLEAGPSHLSNFFKWSKLYEEGGIYADLDILWFKPIDSFYDYLINNKVDVGITQTAYLSIGLLSSSPGAEFYRDIFLNGLRSFNSKEYQTAGVQNIYNLYGTKGSLILNMAMNKYPDLNFYNIPMSLLYHFDSNQIESTIKGTYTINDFADNSIGYHWYAGHPLCQEYNNILNERNYMENKNTFTNISNYIMNL